ncbi:hypothetical protein, partial [Streptomyces sp. NPDC055210]
PGEFSPDPDLVDGDGKPRRRGGGDGSGGGGKRRIKANSHHAEPQITSPQQALAAIQSLNNA